MNFRQKLFYTILGGALVFVGTLANNLSSHETLSNPEFNSIKCNSIIIGGEDKAFITMYAIGDKARIGLKIGNQEINLLCEEDPDVPSCLISLKGGVEGNQLIDLSATQLPAIAPVHMPNQSSGIYIHNKKAVYPSAVMIVDRNGLGRFKARDIYGNNVWKSRTK